MGSDVVHIPLGGRRGAGMFASIDDSAAEQAAGYNWYFTGRYVEANIPGSGNHRTGSGRKIKLHQLVTGRRYVDHKDGDPLNCTSANLRPYDHHWQNMAGQRRRRGSRSPYKGVAARGRRWRAWITVGGQRRNLGSFASAEEAAEAYDIAAFAAWGEWARLNFPEKKEGHRYG